MFPGDPLLVSMVALETTDEEGLMGPRLSWPGKEAVTLGRLHERFSLLTCTLLREGSQSEKATYCMSPTLGRSGKSRIMEATQRFMVAGLEGGQGEREVENRMCHYCPSIVTNVDMM